MTAEILHADAKALDTITDYTTLFNAYYAHHSQAAEMRLAQYGSGLPLGLDLATAMKRYVSHIAYGQHTQALNDLADLPMGPYTRLITTAANFALSEQAGTRTFVHDLYAEYSLKHYLSSTPFKHRLLGQLGKIEQYIALWALAKVAVQYRMYQDPFQLVHVLYQPWLSQTAPACIDAALDSPHEVLRQAGVVISYHLLPQLALTEQKNLNAQLTRVYDRDQPLATYARTVRQDTFLWAAKAGHLSTLNTLYAQDPNLSNAVHNGHNALHLACHYAHNVEAVTWLIKVAKLSIESQGLYQRTPFLYAAQTGNLAMLKYLKEAGAHTDATDKHGYNALHLACTYAHSTKAVFWLINTAKLGIESQERFQRTPFLGAAERGNLFMLTCLKEAGANVHATDKHGYNALHLACLFSHSTKTVSWLIKEAKISIEAQGHHQYTPFLIAAETGNLPLLTCLKEAGANVHATDEHGNNALHLACLFSHSTKTVSWLIEHAKLSIEVQGLAQCTPFLYAATKANLPMLICLKEAGANVHATHEHGNNALHLACARANSTEAVSWLIEQTKLGIETQGQYQRTPFLKAAETGDLAMLKYLKAAGAHTHATDAHGDNALHLACLFSHSIEAVSWLIKTAKLHIESPGRFQRTPFLKAAETGDLAILNYLKDAGANTQAIDKHGNNALHLACALSHSTESVSWLIKTAKLHIESPGRFQRTPFLDAAETGNLPLLKYLKDAGAHVRATDKYGYNALHLACTYAHSLETVFWLILQAQAHDPGSAGKSTDPFLLGGRRNRRFDHAHLPQAGRCLYPRHQ